jgi:hypothetical protein
MVERAFSLDGVNDYVSIPDDSSLDLVGTDFTIDFWLKTTDPDALYLKKYPGLTGPGWGIAQGGSFATTLGFWDGTAWRLSGVSVTTGNWVHIAVVGRISTSQLTWYINGAQGVTVPFTPIANTTAPLFFGTEVPGGAFHLNGLLDEVEIFNRALDQPEIQSIFDAGSSGKCKLPVIEPANSNKYCIIGSSTGLGWPWTLASFSGSVAPLTAGDTATQLATAWVASINNPVNNPAQVVTANQLGVGQDHCFTITPGGQTLTVDTCTVTGGPGCSFNPTVIEVLPVGGIVELLGQSESPAALSGSSSGSDYTAPIAAAVVAGALALAASGWYARRRFR